MLLLFYRAKPWLSSQNSVIKDSLLSWPKDESFGYKDNGSLFEKT